MMREITDNGWRRQGLKRCSDIRLQHGRRNIATVAVYTP